MRNLSVFLSATHRTGCSEEVVDDDDDDDDDDDGGGKREIFKPVSASASIVSG